MAGMVGRKEQAMKRNSNRLSRWPLDSLVVQAIELADAGKNKQAVPLLLRAAKAGNLSAQVNLGHHLYTGKGVRRSREKALYWYKRAARRGDAAAASNIGCIYRDEHRIKLALRWFEKAVALGLDDAMLEIAKLCLGPLGDAKRARRMLARVLTSKEVAEATQEQAVRLNRQLLSRLES
jgi:TPR repeat protein